MIDFHCHLDLYRDPSRIVRECAARGMDVLSVTNTPTAWAGTAALADGNERIHTALGLHPQLARERRGELVHFDRLLPQAKYVGEIGLDGSPECLPYWQDQVAVFEHILSACASSGGRILSIHSRRAEEEVLTRLGALPKAGTPVLHWFSGSRRSLDKAIAIGCWFSVGPTMLAGKRGRGLAQEMPAARILTETDGPFATYEDRPAEPRDVGAATVVLAELWHVSMEEADARLFANLGTLLDSAGAAAPTG